MDLISKKLESLLLYMVVISILLDKNCKFSFLNEKLCQLLQSQFIIKVYITYSHAQLTH